MLISPASSDGVVQSVVPGPAAKQWHSQQASVLRCTAATATMPRLAERFILETGTSSIPP